MIRRIVVPGNKRRRLVFYLAMEEFVAREIEGEAFFMWQVAPTVIFGRNQLMEAEVNVAYCREQGIEIYRRKSGGGCVYADLGNIMLSYIGARDGAWKLYSEKLLSVLRGMGLDASLSGRNDVLVNGLKVSGTAFQFLPSKSVVHGTMLYDSDFSVLEKAIRPSAAKLSSKGVKSARARVGNVKEALENHGTNMDIDEFKERLETAFCDGELVLDEVQIAEIEKIEATYLDDDFLYGHNPKCEVEKHRRIEGVGEFRLAYTARNSVIESLYLNGDYFLANDNTPESLHMFLERLFKGRKMTAETVSRALDGENIAYYISNMTNEELIDLIVN